jgi:hypothetical protein
MWGILGANIYYINGSVGIGTKYPSTKLQVNGSVTVTGTVTAPFFAGNGSQLTGIRYGRPLIVVNDVYGFRKSGSGDYYYNLSSISATNLSGGTYLKIEITGYSIINVTQNGSGYTRLELLTKYIGGSYATSLAAKNFLSIKPVATSSSRGAFQTTNETNCITWYHQLTSNEKTNGVQVQIHIAVFCATNPTGQYADFHNIQTVVSCV